MKKALAATAAIILLLCTFGCEEDHLGLTGPEPTPTPEPSDRRARVEVHTAEAVIILEGEDVIDEASGQILGFWAPVSVSETLTWHYSALPYKGTIRAVDSGSYWNWLEYRLTGFIPDQVSGEVTIENPDNPGQPATWVQTVRVCIPQLRPCY